MDDKQLKYLSEHLENVIDKKVNGKIDRLDKKFDTKFDAHEKKMTPIYEAYTSANNIGKFIIWISKIVLATGIISAGLLAALKFFK